MTRVLFLLLLPLAAQATQPALQPYSATYSLSWGSTGLGKGSISLAPLEEKDCYRYESLTKPVAFVRWIYGSPRETSRFCLREGVLRPQHFEYVNDRREKDNFSLDFDWASRKVKSLKRGVVQERELPESAYDRFLIQLAVRSWVRTQAGAGAPPPLELNMVDDDRIVPYRFEIRGRERVETPAGAFETLLVERTDNPKRALRSWLAPERDFLPVKIEQIEDGEVKLRMLLQ